MKAYVTSIGEITRDLCVWSLVRNGFEVVLIEDSSSLADKLKAIYDIADDDFIRVDADVVPNRWLTPSKVMQIPEEAWWMQYSCYGWFTQNKIYGGVQFIKKEALPALRNNVVRLRNTIRPETELSRISEFYNPRRFVSSEDIMGIHGFAAKDIDRIKQVKRERKQYDNYDWELGERLLGLL